MKATLIALAAAAVAGCYLIHDLRSRTRLLEDVAGGLIQRSNEHGEAIEHLIQDEMYFGEVENGG